MHFYWFSNVQLHDGHKIKYECKVELLSIYLSVRLSAFFLYRVCPPVASLPRCRKRSFDHRQVLRTPPKDTEHLPSTFQDIGCTRSLTRGTDRKIEETVDIAVAVVPVDRIFEPNRRRGPPPDQEAEVRSMRAGESCKLEVLMPVWKFLQVNSKICIKDKK